MVLIEPELYELSALDLEKIIFNLVYTVTFTDINKSATNLVKIYMTIRFRMCFIMGLVGPE